MPRMQLDYYSQTLKAETHMQILHPTPGQFDAPYPVLYLLHGLMVDETAWLRYTMLEEFAKDEKVIIVMPFGGRSFYINQNDGANYSRYITKEIPDVVKSIFKISDKKEDTFIAGMSMGGYGAMHAALSKPDKYGYVASISGTLDIEKSFNNEGKLLRPYEIRNVFGENNPKDGKNDINHLAQKLTESPKIYILCGTEDNLYEQNQEFVDQYKDTLPLDYSFEKGDHDFEYWNRSIKALLDWLPI